MEFNASKYKYLQFFKEASCPIFIQLEKGDWDQEVTKFLRSIMFKEIEETELKKIESSYNHKNFRILTIREASNRLSRQIETFSESDIFGKESIIPRSGHKIYKFKNKGLMIYSFISKEWELAVYSDFGNINNIESSRIIINRFLSWALAPMGIAGFWGVPVDGGVVIMRQDKSIGEVVYFDLVNRQLFCHDGIKKLGAKFKIMRLDSHIHGRNIQMKSEEFLSFLFTHVSYFDYAGPSVPVRQVIQEISKNFYGVYHPQENFRPRTTLS